ncbi:MAG TPA: hypothetical protein PLL25_06805 [Flavobacteriales bacterium]|nr:hypothetical protein [Flavobacteriales bacterium]
MICVLRYFPVVIGGLGVAAFIINLLLGAGLWKPAFELPLWDVQQIECDGNRIHVALGYYSRIQTYDQEGRMIEVLQVDNFSKPFSFRLDASGKPNIRVRGIVPRNERPVTHVKGWTYIVQAPCGVRISQALIWQLLCGPIRPWLLAGAGLLFSLVLFPDVFAKLFAGPRAPR